MRIICHSEICHMVDTPKHRCHFLTNSFWNVPTHTTRDIFANVAMMQMTALHSEHSLAHLTMLFGPTSVLSNPKSVPGLPQIWKKKCCVPSAAFTVTWLNPAWWFGEWRLITYSSSVVYVHWLQPIRTIYIYSPLSGSITHIQKFIQGCMFVSSKNSHIQSQVRFFCFCFLMRECKRVPENGRNWMGWAYCKNPF